MYILWQDNKMAWALGRNGLLKTSGVTVWPDSRGYVVLTPLTSRGTEGRCDIAIPITEINQLIDALTAVRNGKE